MPPGLKLSISTFDCRPEGTTIRALIVIVAIAAIIALLEAVSDLQRIHLAIPTSPVAARSREAAVVAALVVVVAVAVVTVLVGFSIKDAILTCRQGAVEVAIYRVHTARVALFSMIGVDDAIPTPRQRAVHVTHWGGGLCCFT
jgi:hypothetical protein